MLMSKEEMQLLLERIEDYLYEVNDDPNGVPYGMTLHERLLMEGYDEELLHELGIYDQ